jgi:hypothetical protein
MVKRKSLAGTWEFALCVLVMLSCFTSNGEMIMNVAGAHNGVLMKKGGRLWFKRVTKLRQLRCL